MTFWSHVKACRLSCGRFIKVGREGCTSPGVLTWGSEASPTYLDEASPAGALAGTAADAYPRTMIIALHTLVYAHDADAARAFFRDVLELPYARHRRRLAHLQDRPERARRPPRPLGGRRPDGAHDPAVRPLAGLRRPRGRRWPTWPSRGAEFEGEVEQQGWGRTVQLKVPGAGTMLLYQPAYDPAGAHAVSRAGRAPRRSYAPLHGPVRRRRPSRRLPEARGAGRGAGEHRSRGSPRGRPARSAPIRRRARRARRRRRPGCGEVRALKDRGQAIVAIKRVREADGVGAQGGQGLRRRAVSPGRRQPTTT